MTDSLLVGGQVELLGGGIPSQNPLCAGAVFRLMPGGDPGAPQPTTDFVASLILDGERPFGRRASNRTIKLPVWIIAPNRLILAAAREVLQQIIDQDTFTITWTRDPGPGGTGLPLVLDCFRAQPSVPVFNTNLERQLTGMQLTLTIPALPYGRSDQQYTPAFTGSVPQTPAPAPPPSPVVLDNYSTISGANFFQSAQCAVGPFTACWDPDGFGDAGGQNTPLTYSAQFTAPLNLTGMTSLQFWLGLGSRWYPRLHLPGRVGGAAVYVTLTDANGTSISMSRSHLTLPVTRVAQAPVFTRVSIPFPAANPAFAYNQVESYSLTVVSRQDYGRLRLPWVTAYIDALTAFPDSQTATPVTRGNLYTLYGLQGTARAAVNLAFQQPPTPGTATPVTTAGTSTYTVPPGTAFLKVEAVGGGGAGASQAGSGVGGGGGGAEYAAEPVFACSPGDVIPYSVGAGGTPGASPVNGAATYFGPGPAGPMVVQANGGMSAAQNSVTGGAGGSGSMNGVHFPGGAGRTASGAVGGGGGSSGGSASPGSTPVGTGATVFTATGTTPWTAPAGVTQVYAECWGGGGSAGTGGPSTNGGGGGGGEYAAAFITVTPGNSYNVVVGPGGAAVSGSTVSGNSGSSSTFTGDAGASVTAHGGTRGLSAGTGGAGAGGTGSTASVHFSGGPGGPANPYSGGGGASAAPGSPGGNGNGYGSGGVAPSGGGNGGAGSGANISVNGTAGSAPGGGGGGTYGNTTTSGAGAAGQVRLTFPGGAPTNTGAPAVTGGGGGGNGGGSANTAGSSGSQPGGGGGGADSAGTSEAGGNGGTGKLIITPYASAPFKSLIVHRPPLGAVKTFQPLVSIGGGADAPDGTHEYRMPQVISGLNADFGGTYTILLVASSLSGSGSRNYTVTVNQYEFSGGPKYSVTTLPVTITPSQVTNGIITAGVLTLPVKAVAPDNTGGYYTVTPFSSNSADRLFDCILLDTMGSSLIINEPSAGYVNYYADEPQPNLSLGYVLGSNGGRPDAISVLDNTVASGPAIAVEPADGDNQMFVYCADQQAPVISVSYYPRYFFDRYQ